MDDIQNILDKLESQNLLPLYEELIETISLHNEDPSETLRSLIEEQKEVLMEKINLATGSLRAPMSLKGKFSFPDMLRDSDQLLEKYGGHDLAAGFGVRHENLSQLSENFTDYIEKQKLSYETKSPEIIEVELGEIDQEMMEMIMKLDPFGIDFPMPILRAKLIGNHKVTLMNHKTDDNLCHLKIKNITGFDILIFNIEKSFYYENVDVDIFINDIIFDLKLSQNSFKGRTNYQLIADDYKVI